jgi:hypothetical protein
MRKNYGFLRDVSRFYARIWPVITRFPAFVRSQRFFQDWRIMTEVSDVARDVAGTVTARCRERGVHPMIASGSVIG